MIEVSLLEEDNHAKEEIHVPKSNTLGDTLQNTNIMVKDDSNQESEACDHFSIREYVAQARERDPHSCSPFETGKLSLDLLLPMPQKKFRLWDCSDCVSKMFSTDITENDKLALSSDQSANNNAGTCVISFLGTSLVPFSVRDDAEPSELLPSSMNGSNSKKDMTCATTGGCHLQSTPCAQSQDMSDNEPLSTFIKSEKRRVMKEPERTKVHTELEKRKEIHEIMATTSKNSDLPENPIVSKISKVHGKKTRKVRSIAEIIGTDKLVPSQNECTPDDGMTEDLDLVEDNQASEAAGKSGLVKAKLKKKYKALEVVVPSLKECSPVDGMGEYLSPIKENQASEIVCKSVLMKAKPKKNYKTVEVVVPPQKECTSSYCMDDDLTPIEENRASEVACRSGLIKVKSKKKYKALEVVDETFSKLRLKKGKKRIRRDKCAEIKNLESQNITYPPLRGLSLEKPSIAKSEEKQLLIGTVVRRKRTKKPRKFVCAVGTAGEIVKSCHKPLQLTGNKEDNDKKDQLKIVSQKRKVENSKPECSAQRSRKKKQKISENISNDIPMDIVELLAKNLREKHLTDEMDCNSNSNTNSDLKESPQIMLPNGRVINFSTQKSASDRTSETSAFKYVPHPIHCQSPTHTGNINLSTARIDPKYGYMMQFPNGSVQQLGNGRCLDLGCTLLQLNANPVPQMEFYRNEVIPATHLLQLMNSSASSSPSLNLRGFSERYNPPVSTNHYQNVNQNPCKLFRPQPRLGVFGSQLQKEITSPANNCGTQSGYRIGNGPIPAEGICIVNRNPADFTVIDENNEFLIDGREIKPITGAYYGNLDGVAYLSRGINNSNRAFQASDFCTTVL